MASLITKQLAGVGMRISQPNTRSIISTLLHGSAEAKKAGEIDTQQHSRLVARGKYIHAFEEHRVKPDRVEEYKKAAEEYYSGLAADESLHVKLTGSWESIVGPKLDTFIHILEYENYSGYDKTTQLTSNSKHRDALNALRPYLNSRSSQLCQEFAFFPSSPPKQNGGVYELRSYTLKPGALLEWENAWRIGIEARKKVVAPVGAWFSQIGRLHQVHHIWQYKDLNTRREARERAWKEEGWPETVVKTARLTDLMDASMLQPMSWSPLK